MACTDVLCEPCLYVEIETKAVGFCSTCAECLCSKCLVEHRKAKMTRNHSVQQDIIQENVDVIKAMNEMMACPVHREMKIVYRCNDHSVCVCTLCRVDTHRNCENVFEIAKAEKADRDLSEIHENLVELKDSAATLRKRKEKNKTSLFQNQTQILSVQEGIIKQAIDRLGELKEQHRKETNEHLQVAVSEIDKDIESVDAIEKSCTRNQDILEAASKYGDNECPTVIAHILADTMITNKDLVSDLRKKDELKLKFEKNQNCIISSSLGTISVLRGEIGESKAEFEFGIEKTSDEILESNSSDLFAEKATVDIPHIPPNIFPTLEESCFISSTTAFYVGREKDNNWSSIFGSVLLPDGHLVIIDYDNTNIKLLSSEFRLVHVLRLPGKPVRICAIGTDRVAVSFERVKRINRYIIHDSEISYEGGFSTSLFNHGLAFDGHHIVALMSDEEFQHDINAKDDTIQVEIRNASNGKVIEVIQEFKVVGNKTWSLVLNNIRALSITEDNNIVIAEQNRVLCFILTKESKKTVAIEKRYYVCPGDTHIPKNSIENITSDSDSIYVCTNSGSVLQLSASDYNVNRVILPYKDKKFRSITVDSANSRIILGCENNDIIYVHTFQIESL